MALWSGKPTTHTNAPRNWPRIELAQFEDPGINLIQIAAQLAEHARPPRGTLAFMRDFVYEDGILRVPLVVEEGGTKTAIFCYSSKDAGAAAHYSGVRSLLRTREGMGAVYYAGEAFAPTKPGSVLEAIDTPFFSKDEKAPDADFALWWASDETPRLRDSDERRWLDTWFESLDGYGFLLLTAFLNDLELVEGKSGLYGLPAQPLLQPLIGPGETRMLLYASEAEGLFLSFDERTAPSRRRVLLRLLADFAAKYRRTIEARGVPARAEEKGPGLATWRAARDAALEKEERGEAGLKLWTVALRDGQTLRDPGVSGILERAARPKAPGREELDFGMDLVERVAARLEQGGSTGSTNEALAGPNFFPVIAVLVGSDVIERQLPYEEAPVALAAAARARDEWPDASLVAVLTDGAIRENGARVDVFGVSVENLKEARAASLVQRYRVGAGGAVELFGRPTVHPAEPFVLTPTGGLQPAPDEGLVAIARQALETIVRMLTIIDPSGMSGDDPEDVLVMPSALVGKAGDERPTVMRYMLQGPLTAALSCCEQMQKEPGDWVAFHIDDLVSRNGSPDRRLRLCVQRRQDPGAAIFDQAYAPPTKGVAFAPRGGLEFRRWAGPILPPAS